MKCFSPRWMSTTFSLGLLSCPVTDSIDLCWFDNYSGGDFMYCSDKLWQHISLNDSVVSPQINRQIMITINKYFSAWNLFKFKNNVSNRLVELPLKMFFLSYYACRGWLPDQVFVSVSTFFGTLFDNFDVVELTYDGTNLHQRTMITGVNDFKLKGAFLFAAKSRVGNYT